MDQLNKLRLLAGLGIDPKTMVTPKPQAKLNEYHVPQTKGALVPKNEETMRLRASKAQEAHDHLVNAVKAIGAIPAVDFSGDFAHYAHELKELLSSDGGQAGFTNLVKLTQSDYRKWKRSENSRVRMEQEEEAMMGGIEGAVDALGAAEERSKATKFGKGQAVTHLGEPMTVVVANTDGDYVAISPPGKENDINALQLVHCSELEIDQESDEVDVESNPPSDDTEIDLDKPEGEEPTAEVGAVSIDFSDDGEEDPDEDDLEVASLKDEVKLGEGKKVMEKVNYYYDTTEGGANGADKGTVFEPKTDMDKNENPNQLDSLGAASMGEHEKKVRVPANVKKALKDAVAEVEQQFVRLGSTESDAKFFYKNLLSAYTELLAHIEGGTVNDIKKAQIFMTTLMGPILHKIPAVVVNFVAKGGEAPTLKDYFKPVDSKYPITGPRNNLK